MFPLQCHDINWTSSQTTATKQVTSLTTCMALLNKCLARPKILLRPRNREGGEQSIILLPHVCFAYVNRQAHTKGQPTRRTHDATEPIHDSAEDRNTNKEESFRAVTERLVPVLACMSKSCPKLLFHQFSRMLQLQNQKNSLMMGNEIG